MFSDFHIFSLFFIVLLLISSNGIPPTNANYYDALKEHRHKEFSLGAIVDYNSRAGKEEKVAIKMAMEDFFGHILSYRPTLHVMNSRGDPVQAASSGESFSIFYLRSDSLFKTFIGQITYVYMIIG